MSNPERDDDRESQERGPQTNPSLSTGGLRRVTLSHTKTTAPVDTVPHGTTEGAVSGDPYIGATVDGRYFVEDQLGEGGMGVVYRCRHTIIDKKVAMKVLRADMARNEEVTERFLNEARSASSIGNPHIIDISDFGRLPDGATYFIMEFLVGTPLADLAGAGVPLPPERIGNIALQLTEGLAAAHEEGIIHRDLKPDNVHLIKRGHEPDFVKILDFGIAKASSSTNKLTQAGQVFGTPHYMSPEQASGSPVDHRSDIYALGVMLYELSTGRLPFDADNFMAILTQHMYKEPVRPSLALGLSHALPEGFEDLILKCMAKDPDRRYQSMNELGEDLVRIFSGLAPVNAYERRSRVDSADFGGSRGAQAEAAPQQRPAEKKPARLLYAAVGLFAAAVAVVAVLLTKTSDPEPLAQTPASETLAEAKDPVAPQAPAPAALPAVPEKKPESPKLTSVAIAVAPISAHVFEGETDLGKSPVMLEVGETPKFLEVRLPGYETQELKVDGTEPKLTVELVKVKSKVPPRPRPAEIAKPNPAPAPKKQPGGGELVNPWD